MGGLTHMAIGASNIAFSNFRINCLERTAVGNHFAYMSAFLAARTMVEGQNQWIRLPAIYTGMLDQIGKQPYSVPFLLGRGPGACTGLVCWFIPLIVLLGIRLLLCTTIRHFNKLPDER